jgi:hypothetical protein
MKSRVLRALLPAALFGVLVFAVPAAANHSGEESNSKLRHVANLDKEGTNSDLAFWENIAAAGHFGGFRLIDISKPEKPKVIIDFPCNGGQSDMSFYKAKDRLLLFQSVDTPQTNSSCASSNWVAALPPPAHWEGIRIFDVTNASVTNPPKHIASVYTDCGSHTHTTIPDDENQRAIIYVSSYPLSPTGIGAKCPEVPPDILETFPPDADVGKIIHSKISVIEVPDDNPAAASVIGEPRVHTHVPGGTPDKIDITGCHDIDAFTDPKVQTAAAACLAADGQLWDISDPANPCTDDEACHTHMDNPLVEFWHSAAFTWDAEIVMFWDEHGGGMAHGCNGSTDTTGNIWFYKNVPPGSPTPPLFGRYQVPRPEPPEQTCDLHIGSIIPVNDNERYIGVSSVYEGGVTVFDFTQLKPVNSPVPVLDPLLAPIVAQEYAYWDNENNTDGRGYDDVWSAYWYNDYIFTNGGLNARQAPPRNSNRGFDVYKLLDERGRHFTARSFHHFNPQTQEVFETLGG